MDEVFGKLERFARGYRFEAQERWGPNNQYWFGTLSRDGRPVGESLFKDEDKGVYTTLNTPAEQALFDEHCVAAFRDEDQMAKADPEAFRKNPRLVTAPDFEFVEELARANLAFEEAQLWARMGDLVMGREAQRFGVYAPELRRVNAPDTHENRIKAERAMPGWRVVNDHVDAWARPAAFAAKQAAPAASSLGSGPTAESARAPAADPATPGEGTPRAPAKRSRGLAP